MKSMLDFVPIKSVELKIVLLWLDCVLSLLRVLYFEKLVVRNQFLQTAIYIHQGTSTKIKYWESWNR